VLYEQWGVTLGNNDDSRMQWLFAEEGKEISTIGGYKRTLPLAD
jgi:hypothetical protein